MATAYIDVAVQPGIGGVPAPTDTSTVTNKVRVAWDTTVSRGELNRTLQEIADAVLNADVVPASKVNGS